MNIIITANFSPWSPYSGGGQRSTHNIATTMAGKGHNVHVIFTKASLESIEVPEKLKYTLHWANFPGFKTKRTSITRNLSCRTVANIAQNLVNTMNGDVILHSNGEEGALLHTVKAKPKQAIGIISTVRYSYYPPLLAKPNKSIFDKLNLWINENKYLHQGEAAKNAHFVCPPSKWAGDEVIRTYGVSPEKVEAVHNGVPAEFLEYHRDHKSAQNGPIVFFGRIAKDKGVDTAITAYAKLDKAIQQQHPLLIIGKGPEEDKSKDQVKNLGLENNIQFLGWKNHHELGRILSKAKMCVLPSRDENFSLAILSALCVGCPTISTSIGGSPEIIKNESLGKLIKPNQVDDLAKAIAEFLDPYKNIEMGERVSAYVRSELTWQHAATHFEQMYNKALISSITYS